MEFYNRLIEFVDVNLIYCLIPIIITLLVVELIFKNRFKTKKALNLVRWTIIIYTISTYSVYLIQMVLNQNGNSIHPTGSHIQPDWLLIFCAVIFPLTLFLKRLGANFWYVLFVAIVMKIGTYFDLYVLFSTSFHRDYLPENGNNDILVSLLYDASIVTLQGVVIVIFTFSVFEILKKQE